jgi:hypothetical protein
VADSINILSYRNFAIIEFNFLKDISIAFLIKSHYICLY